MRMSTASTREPANDWMREMFHVKHGEKAMEKNKTYRAEITGLTAEGAGVARIDGQVVFVPGVIPGETCEIKIDHVGRTCAYGSLVRAMEASPHRVEPECPYFGRCGGCVFWHMDYACELEQKKRRVQDALSRIGGVEFPDLQITGSESIYGYRNKVQFPVQAQNGKPVAGFYRAGSHAVIAIADCKIQPESANRAREAVLRWMEKENIAAYDERTHTGVVRHIYLRAASKDPKVLLCLIVNGKTLAKKEALVRTIREQVPEVSGIVINYNTKKSNVILGDRFEALTGDGALEDTLLGLTFRLSPAAFYQVNHDQAERLYETAIEFAGLRGEETALDLYCGSGTITLCLARHVKKVYGVEIVDAAIRDAKENAARNGISNTEFFCADAGEAAAKFARDGIKPDVIVIDPPRKGVSEDVIAAMAQMAPARIVYVSCDPATLARDVARLREKGYEARKAHCFDLFPRCAHVETVVLLSKGEVDSKKIRVEFSLEDMDMSEFQDGATYPQIKEYVLEHTGLKVSNLYISQIKRKCGIEVGKNYNLPKSEDSRQPQCPPEKEKAIREAFKYFGMI